MKLATVVNETYHDHWSYIVRMGERVRPRGIPTIEVVNATLIVPVGTIVRRKGMNARLGYMEGIQIIAGVFDSIALQAAAPNVAISLFTGQSAYGPRIVDQVPRVIGELIRDQNSRRAVVILPNVEVDSVTDLPCTESIQFIIRDGVLTTIANMRSSDATYGIPYDIMQFSFLAQAVGACSHVPVGRLIINMASAHIYEDKLDLTPHRGAGLFDIPYLRHWHEYLDWAGMQLSVSNWHDGRPQGVKEYR